MTKKQKKILLRIIVAAILFVAALFVPSEYTAVRLAAFLVPYFVIGWDILWKAIRNIFHGQIFDENFLMAIATVGAFFLGEYPEGVAVMLFYQTGELFQSCAVGKSRESISALMEIRPDYANVERDGKIETVDPDEVEIGEIIVVKPGERISLDGVIAEGTSMLDTSALTGESMPRDVADGDEVISGSVNISGVLRICTTKTFGESTVSKILDLVENTSGKKAKAENFITRFARYYTPCVVIGAVLLAVVPSVIFGNPSEWIGRALTFLVISCPCALVISVPLSFFGGIGGAARCGILVKGGNYLEALSKTGTVVFDKTGTLTKGVFRVTSICPEGMTENELIEIAALAESYSNHPISKSLREAYGKEIDNSRISSTEEITGKGVSAVVDGKSVLAGNGKLMDSAGVEWNTPDATGTVVYVAVDGKYAGCIVISDEVKENSAKAISALKALGVRKTVMLTGDSKEIGESVAKTLGLDEAYTQLLPADKVERVEQLLSDSGKDSRLVFVGDGINDAPVLSRADIGIAMGGIGSDAAIEASDIVLMDDNPAKIAKAIEISRRTVSIVNQNIIFALSVKGIVLVLGALGFANMWLAVFADVGVSVIAILNAMRALKAKE